MSSADWTWKLTVTFTDNAQQVRSPEGYYTYIGDALAFDNWLLSRFRVDVDDAQMEVMHGTLSPRVVVEFADLALVPPIMEWLASERVPVKVEWAGIGKS